MDPKPSRLSAPGAPTGLPKPERPSTPRANPVPHDYCFSDASHAASFYLKVFFQCPTPWSAATLAAWLIRLCAPQVGAAGFCFGHLVHASLLLAYQAMFLIQDPDEFYKCASPATLVLDVLYPVYSFLQLFFIFKYSNVCHITSETL